MLRTDHRWYELGLFLIKAGVFVEQVYKWVWQAPARRRKWQLSQRSQSRKGLWRFAGCSARENPPVTIPRDIESTAGKLWNYPFSAGAENAVTGKGSFLELSVMGLVPSLAENKNFNGKPTKARWGKCKELNLVGRRSFLAGHPFTLSEQRLSGGCYLGCSG